MKKALLLLGSNLNNRLEYLRKAIDLLDNNNIKVIKTSSVYESEAVGYDSFNKYYNVAVEIAFFCSSLELLSHCLRIETQLGRERKENIRYSDRTIDIDIILIQNKEINTPRLTVPHPRMHLRDFCLVPINEIASDWKIKTLNSTVQEALNKLTKSNLVVKKDVEI